MIEWNLTVLKLFCRGKKSCTLTNIWVNLWLMIIAAMTKPAQWCVGNWFYISCRRFEMYTQPCNMICIHNHSHAEVDCRPLQSTLQWSEKTHTPKRKRRKKKSCQPGYSPHHAFHPHPLSKKPEVNSFPYSLSLSHRGPSHTFAAPVKAPRSQSRWTLTDDINLTVENWH